MPPRSVVYKKKPKEKRKQTLPELIASIARTREELRRLDALAAKRAEEEAGRKERYGAKVSLGGLTLGVRKEFLGKTKQAVSEIGTSALYTPAGIYEAGKAVGLDVRDVTTGRDFTPTRSRTLGEAIGRATIEDIRHPLRHPGYSALTAFAIASGGAGAASRLRAAGTAAAAAPSIPRGVAYALLRKPSEGGSLLRRPAPGRIRIAEGADINLSPNALVRAGQRRGAKRAVEGKAISTSAALGPAPGIPGRSLPRRIGLERAARERILRDVERASAEGLLARARKLDVVEQTAVRIVAEGQPIVKRIAAHQRDMARVVGNKPTALLTRRRLKDKIRILREVEKRRLVNDSGTKPIIRAGSASDEAYALSKASAARRQEILTALDLLDEEGAQARVSAPGRVIEGAEFKRTRAQKGRKVEHVREYRTSGETVTRPRTEVEAAERLAKLDVEYERAIRLVEQELAPGGFDPADVARRNLENRRRQRGRRRQEKLPTHKQELRRMAEEQLEDLASRHSDNPTMASIGRLIEERKTLRTALQDPEHVFGGAPVATGALGTTRYTTPDKVTRRTFKAQEGRPASAGLKGAEEFTGGEFFISNVPRRGVRTSVGRIGGGGGVGIPRKPGSVTQQFTGESIRTGRFQNKAVRQVAESELEAQRYRWSLQGREIALADSISAEDLVRLPLREQRHYRPVRVEAKPYTAATKDFLDAVQGKLEDNVPLSELERSGLRDQVRRVHESLFPKLDEVSAEAASGQVRFYDRRRLGGLDELTTPITKGGRITATMADEINAGMQLAILFLKPAYLIPNMIGQTALTFIEQGFAAPWNAAKAIHLYRSLSPEERAAVRGAAGLGFAHALPAERGRILTPARGKAASAYGKVLDSPYRWSSFVHNARLLGYDTVPKIRTLLSKEANLDDLVEVARRVRDNMVDYQRLGSKERKIVGRAIFFYGWTKGSTLYTGRFVRDHPLQAAVAAQLGRYGEEKAQEDLGDVPGFARGIFKVGEDEQGRPLVADPRAAALFGSPVELAEAGVGLIRSFTGDPRPAAYELEDLISPAAVAPIQFVAPHDPLSGYQLPRGEALKREYLQSLPQYRLASGLQAKAEDQEGRLYPTDPETAIGRFTVGGLYPHPVDLEELEARAAQERRLTLSPAERAFEGVFEEREKVFVAAKEFVPEQLENGRLPEWIREAYNMKAERAAAWARVEAKPGTADFHRGRLEAELRLLAKWKIMPAQAAGTWLEWAKTAELDDLKKGRDKLSNLGFEKAYMKGIRKVKTVLKKKGASLD